MCGDVGGLEGVVGLGVVGSFDVVDGFTVDSVGHGGKRSNLELNFMKLKK